MADAGRGLEPSGLGAGFPELCDQAVEGGVVDVTEATRRDVGPASVGSCTKRGKACRVFCIPLLEQAKAGTEDLAGVLISP